MKLVKLIPVLTALGVGACTAYQGTPSNPIEQSLTWFSFVAGDDIRAVCRAGEPDHYRFVYNGIYEVQIRAYELTPTPGGAELTVRARGRSGLLNRFTFEGASLFCVCFQSDVRMERAHKSQIGTGLAPSGAKTGFDVLD